MSAENQKLKLYRPKDVVQSLLGIPLVITFALVCANFVTSYAGI